MIQGIMETLDGFIYETLFAPSFVLLVALTTIYEIFAVLVIPQLKKLMLRKGGKAILIKVAVILPFVLLGSALLERAVWVVSMGVVDPLTQLIEITFNMVVVLNIINALIQPPVNAILQHFNNRKKVLQEAS